MKSFSLAVVVLVGASTFPSISASSCTVSTPNWHWQDLHFDGCEWYEANDTPGCPLYGHDYEDENGTANDNCCYCMSTDVRVPSCKMILLISTLLLCLSHIMLLLFSFFKSIAGPFEWCRCSSNRNTIDPVYCEPYTSYCPKNDLNEMYPHFVLFWLPSRDMLEMQFETAPSPSKYVFESRE